MKRLLLLPPAFLLLSIATPAFALSADCQTVLSVAPVSPYVQAVLTRADAGLTYAKSAPALPVFGFFIGDWAQAIASAMAQLMNTNVQVTIQADDLIHHSACLNFDATAIKCKMQQVQDEMQAGASGRSLIALWQLRSLLTFLNDRLTQFYQGALDPNYADPDWGSVQIFDPPQNVYCYDSFAGTCRQTTSAACALARGSAFRTQIQCQNAGGLPLTNQNGTQTNDVMCPYDSDYGPSLQNGFGCDLDVMAPRIGFAPVKTEYDALNAVIKQIDAARAIQQQLLGVQNDIDTLTGNQTASPPALAPRTHISAVGCAPPPGICSNNQALRCSGDADCVNGGTCQTATSVCSLNRSITCLNDDSQCTVNGQNFGTCIPNDGKIPATVELRGPFSLGKNERELVSDFLLDRLQTANSRSTPDSLATPGTVSNNTFSKLVAGSYRLLFNAWSLFQGRDEAINFPIATDPELEIASALTPLRKAVGDLARLVLPDKTQQKQGLRDFVIKYAYFLRRSCINRPCNASLEEILKIAFADACFPYTNGDFLDDSPDSPRYQKCLDKAGIQLPNQ